MAKVTTERHGKSNQPAVYLVRVDGVVRGRVEKYPNTRTDTHPWKAFGLAPDPKTPAPVLAFFWPVGTSLYADRDRHGNKRDAVALVANS